MNPTLARPAETVRRQLRRKSQPKSGSKRSASRRTGPDAYGETRTVTGTEAPGLEVRGAPTRVRVMAFDTRVSV